VPKKRQLENYHFHVKLKYESKYRTIYTSGFIITNSREKTKIRNGRAKIYNRKTSVAISLQFTQTVHGLNDPFYIQTSCTHHKKIKMFSINAYYCLQIQIRWKRKSNQELVVFYHAMKRGSPPVLLCCYKPLHISSSWLPWN